MGNMRQWDLIGITDADPKWEVVPAASIAEPDDTHWTFYWSTDTELRFRSVSDAAAVALGEPPWRCEGQDLLAVFGIEGTNLAVLEAHTSALDGREATFTLQGQSGRVRCRVGPTHASDGRVIGTFCLADEGEPDDPAAMPLVAAAMAA